MRVNTFHSIFFSFKKERGSLDNRKFLIAASHKSLRKFWQSYLELFLTDFNIKEIIKFTIMYGVLCEYIYTCACMHVCVYMYTYVYIIYMHALVCV